MSVLSLTPAFSNAFRTRALASSSYFPRYLHSVGTSSHTSPPWICSSLNNIRRWECAKPRLTWFNRTSTISQLSGRARPPSRGPRSSWGGRGQKKSPFAFLDNIPQDYIFWGIIGTNVVVFFMWYAAGVRYQVEHNPTDMIWMRRNFTSSWQNFREGRIWAPITAMFSHQDLTHLFFNMFTFYFLGQPVLRLLGTRQFLSLYLGGGAIASFGSMFWHNKIQGHDVYSQGASGAVFATNAYLACVAPTMSFLIYGIIPVPAWLFVSGVFVYDTYSAWSKTRPETDTAGHVAGILAGVGYFLMRRVGF